MTTDILIIDFGSQVTQLIARRVREAEVYCEIHPYTSITEEFFNNLNPKGVIFSGGPSSAHEEFSPSAGLWIFEKNIPVLGICYGQQLICKLLGGKVSPAKKREFGRSYITICKESSLFTNSWELNKNYPVWMSHGDKVDEIPKGFEVQAYSENAPFAVIANEEKKIYGVQFHPEVTHTPDGLLLIKNFLFNIVKCEKNWNMSSFLENKCKKIQETVGNKNVLCAISGGVDSSVAASLVYKAIGKQLKCFFVDTGLLRKDEGLKVKERFEKTFHIPINYINASEEFLSKLKGVDDPEKKRKIIGKIFIEIFEKEAKNIDNIDFLVQGTLYPDVIESVSVYGKSSVTIKSHHNVGGLPENMNLKLLEPLRELFKDEVRLLGEELNISKELLYRHPFPGPGLAIRIIGEITEEKIKILQEADSIFLSELKKEGLYSKIWQAFCVLLPIKTVGVMGDSRTYEYTLALRAVTSKDGMTSDFYHFDFNFLSKISTKIINNVKGINRVVYDITSKPPATIEWE